MRLYSRPGNDLTRRFPLIVETLARLRSRSCIVDGEASPAMTISIRCSPRASRLLLLRTAVEVPIIWIGALRVLRRISRAI